MGFGVIENVGNKYQYVGSGVIRINTDLLLPERLQVIYEGITEVIGLHKPAECAVEQVFLAKNASSALKLGQARGAAIVAATNCGLPVSEYEAKKVKQAVVGTGAADKSQVQQMVKLLLNLKKVPPEDAADALAVAMCHASYAKSAMIGSSTSLRYRKKRLQ